MYVKKGSRLVYVCSYDNSLLTRLSMSPGQMLSNISSDLANLHNIVVEDSKNDLSVLTAKVNYTLNLLVNDTDYASEQDVRSIVDHYFYTQGGELPAASRIVSVRPPAGDTVDTGAPDAPPDDPATPGGGPSWWDRVWGKVEAGGVGVLFGAAAVIGLVVFITVKEAVE